jgi:PadR family transcriptional regulator, regulatory protein PadR
MEPRVVNGGESHDAANGKLDTELRRGVLVLAVLSQLRTPQYGYSLRQALAEEGMAIEEGTLYPLLRRLESQGLLASEWRIEDGPPRRYYTLSPEGVRHYANLRASWSTLAATVSRLISDKKEDTIPCKPTK